MGKNAKKVQWITSDVLTYKPTTKFDIWHDRATFHFLTKQNEIEQYSSLVMNAMEQGGIMIIGTFSTHGPNACSGLPITQYYEAKIKNVFGESFVHLKSFEEVHNTPFKTQQSFLWSVFQKK